MPTDINCVHSVLEIMIRAASTSSALANWRGVAQALHAVSSCQEMLCMAHNSMCPRATNPAQRMSFLDSGKM